MAISKVQNAVYKSEADASVTVSFPNTPTEGNLMIALGKSGTNSYTNGSITGWALATGTRTGTTAYMGIWYKVAGAAESKDVTLDWTDSTNTLIAIEEWAGLTSTPLDQIANVDNTGPVTSKSSGTTPTTTVADELCVAGFAMGGVVTNQSWSNSFTEELDQDSFFLGSKIVSATGTQETTLSWTTARVCGGLIATFKGASAAATWIPKVIMVM